MQSFECFHSLKIEIEMFWKMKFFNCSKDKAGTRHRAKQKKNQNIQILPFKEHFPAETDEQGYIYYVTSLQSLL